MEIDLSFYRKTLHFWVWRGIFSWYIDKSTTNRRRIKKRIEWWYLQHLTVIFWEESAEKSRNLECSIFAPPVQNFSYLAVILLRRRLLGRRLESRIATRHRLAICRRLLAECLRLRSRRLVRLLVAAGCLWGAGLLPPSPCMPKRWACCERN